MLPENVEDNDGWQREAHGYPPFPYDESDHGIVRRLP